MRSFNVVGDAVNVASRLESSAQPGTVLIGESTYKTISDRVDVTPLGALDLKGKETAIVAYLLKRVRPPR
jgi:class 3 adenylate cyclase